MQTRLLELKEVCGRRFTIVVKAVGSKSVLSSEETASFSWEKRRCVSTCAASASSESSAESSFCVMTSVWLMASASWHTMRR